MDAAVEPERERAGCGYQQARRRATAVTWLPVLSASFFGSGNPSAACA